MVDYFVNLYNTFASLGQESPLIAGMVGVWFAAISTYLLRDMPRKVYNLIKRQITTSLIIYDQNTWSASGRLFGNFQEWVESLDSLKFSRVFTVASNLDSSRVVPGTGIHVFIYKNKLFWFYIEELDSSGSEKVKRKVILNTFGRNKEILDTIFQEFKDFDKSYESIKKGNYVFTQGYWNKVGESSEKSLDNVFLNTKTKESILNAIDNYTNNKHFYTRAGLPYKMSMMLYGPPGTGKTSIIKAIANYLNKRTYILPLDKLTSEGMVSALAMAKGGIVVIEDIDGVSAIKKRTEGEPSFMDEMNGIHDILNAFDGVVEISDVIIIMTTNHLEKIDPAFLRPGRTDYIIEVGELDKEAVCGALETMFEKEVNPDLLEDVSISGANLSKIYKDTYPDLDMAIKTINENFQKGEIQ